MAHGTNTTPLGFGTLLPSRRPQLLKPSRRPATASAHGWGAFRTVATGASGQSSLFSGRRAAHLTCSSFVPGASALRITRRTTRRHQNEAMSINARVRDPDAAEEETENPDKFPPNMFWKVMAAFMYMIPWIDAVGLGREIYHKFPVFIYLYHMTGPFVGIYYSSQFAPLVVFFLMFLAVVKNNKLSHFVRFNCMQAIMLDIVVMLLTILHSYFPAELRWSWVLSVFDCYSWTASMAAVLYCVFFTLRGVYADIPYVSEAVYIQVEMSEYA